MSQPPSIDLYRAYGLNRGMPPAEIGQRLTEILSSTQDPVARGRIETARAILADPLRRARYDAQLGDPNAPPITEQTLAQLAGRPAPTAPGSGSGLAQLAGRPKVLAGIAAALVLLLVVIVTAVSCSGGNDDGSDRSDGKTAGQSSRSAADSSSPSWLNDDFKPINTDLYPARWTSKSKDKRPKLALQLTKAIDLPAGFSALSKPNPSCVPDTIPGYPFNNPMQGIFQLRGGSVALICGEDENGSDKPVAVHAVTVNKDGQVLGTQTMTRSRTNNQIDGTITLDYFDLPKESQDTQYFRVQGSDGITIPAGSTGLTDDMVFVVQALPDAFDESIVWVLLRASDKLYQAKVVNPGQ